MNLPIAFEELNIYHCLNLTYKCTQTHGKNGISSYNHHNNENTSVHYTAMPYPVKFENFQLTDKYFNVFQNFIDCGHTLEFHRRVPTLYVLDQK